MKKATRAVIAVGLIEGIFLVNYATGIRPDIKVRVTSAAVDTIEGLLVDDFKRSVPPEKLSAVDGGAGLYKFRVNDGFLDSPTGSPQLTIGNTPGEATVSFKFENITRRLSANSSMQIKGHKTNSADGYLEALIRQAPYSHDWRLLVKEGRLAVEQTSASACIYNALADVDQISIENSLRTPFYGFVEEIRNELSKHLKNAKNLCAVGQGLIERIEAYLEDDLPSQSRPWGELPLGHDLEMLNVTTQGDFFEVAARSQFWDNVTSSKPALSDAGEDDDDLKFDSTSRDDLQILISERVLQELGESINGLLNQTYSKQDPGPFDDVAFFDFNCPQSWDCIGSVIPELAEQFKDDQSLSLLLSPLDPPKISVVEGQVNLDLKAKSSAITQQTQQQIFDVELALSAVITNPQFRQYLDVASARMRISKAKLTLIPGSSRLANTNEIALEESLNDVWQEAAIGLIEGRWSSVLFNGVKLPKLFPSGVPLENQRIRFRDRTVLVTADLII